MSRNWKARNLLTRLLNHTCVKQVKEKPLVLQRIEEKDAGTTGDDSGNTAAVDNDGNIG